MGFDLSVLKKIGDAIVDYAPTAAGVLTATGVGAPAGAVVGVVAALGRALGLGSEATPEQIHQTLQANPELAAKTYLAELEYRDNEAQRRHVEVMQVLGDVQHARMTNTEQVKATGRRDTNLYVLAYLYITGFFGSTGVMIFAVCTNRFPKDIPEAAVFLLGNLFGALTAGSGSVVQYFFGSSRSSAEKTQLLTYAGTKK